MSAADSMFVSGLLLRRRREIGTRALSCRKQAVFALAWFRDRPDIRPAGPGGRDLAGHRLPVPERGHRGGCRGAPSLREALDKAVGQGLPYLILDGTLVASDRCAEKKTSKEGKEIDK
jgi:hypothetical protein